jgi:hypothetical protein
MKKELQILNRLGVTQGDSVTVPKSIWNVVQHHALYLGADYHGNHWMCENLIGNGVKLTRVEEFFRDVSKVTSIKRFGGTYIERVQAVQKALSLLGKPYDLINYNCEHFVNDVLHNQVRSSQVNAAKSSLGFLFCVLLVALIVES